MSGFLRCAHQLEARIGHQWRAGIRNERDGCAGGQPLQELRARYRGVVVVVGCERGGNAIAIQQLARHAGIFAGDQIGAGKGRERAQGDVA